MGNVSRVFFEISFCHVILVMTEAVKLFKCKENIADDRTGNGSTANITFIVFIYLFIYFFIFFHHYDTFLMSPFERTYTMSNIKVMPTICKHLIFKRQKQLTLLWT
jgi:hypothetical protein